MTPLSFFRIPFLKGLEIIVILFFLTTASSASASTSFLKQEIKENALSFNNEYRQTFSCNDLTGEIDQVIISMTRTGVFSANWRAEFLGSGVVTPTFTSSNTVTLGPRFTPTDVVFNFNDPISIKEELCVNGVSNVALRIVPDSTDQNYAALINGSVNNPYLNGHYSFNNTSTSDIYFILRMQNNTNSAPSFVPISTQITSENSSLGFGLTANDPDNDSLTYTASNLPAGATFDPNTQTFSWAPDYDDAGTYNITFTVTDDRDPTLFDTETVTILVENTNRSPVIVAIGNQTVAENETLVFTIVGSDPDNDSLTYTASNLPAGATFDPNTQTFSWTPDYDDAGLYEGIHFIVSDNGNPALTDSESIAITVNNINRAPVLTPIGNQTVNENNTLRFTISATDPDNDILSYAASNLPAGATFDPNTQTFSWAPDYDDSGNYTDIEFSVTDNGTPLELDVELITVTVGDVNRAPELTNPGPQQVLENTPLIFSISASDPDNDEVSILASNMPPGATFNGSMFMWTPTITQEGIYTIRFLATDNGAPNESSLLEVVIVVGNNPTPTEQAKDLVDTIIILDIPQNVENSYLANLQKVEQFIIDGKIQAALNQLQAFINKVNTDYQHGVLTIVERNGLILVAENLIDDLGG